MYCSCYHQWQSSFVVGNAWLWQLKFFKNVNIVKLMNKWLLIHYAHCPACGEEEETSYHLLGKCCAYMVSRYSITVAYTMEPEELGKVRPTTLLQFMRATKRFCWPLVVLGLHTGPNIHSLSGGRLRPSAPKVKIKDYCKRSVLTVKTNFVIYWMLFCLQSQVPSVHYM